MDEVQNLSLAALEELRVSNVTVANVGCGGGRVPQGSRGLWYLNRPVLEAAAAYLASEDSDIGFLYSEWAQAALPHRCLDE